MKTELKHAKAEWNINNLSTGDSEIWAIGIPKIAMVFGMNVSINDQKANAKLIAAAPDMIEALQSVNNYFIDLQNKCALTAPDERAWKLVSKAINKVIL